MIPRSTPYVWQPQSPISVDRGNSLTDRLTLAWTPNVSVGTDAAFNNAIPTYSIGGTFDTSIKGRNYTAVAGSSGGLTFSGRLKQVISAGSTSYTILSLSQPFTSSQRGSFLTNGTDGSPPWAQQAFLANAANGTNFSGKIELNEYDNVQNFLLNSTNIVVDGNWHVFVAMRTSATTGLMFVDGVETPSTSSGSTTANVLAGDTRISGAQGSTRTLIYPQALLLVWDRILSREEVARISANVWQIFSIRRSTPVSSVAIIKPTLTAAFANSITTSTAMPQVTFTRP